MNWMALIAIISALVATFALCAARYHANRAANLTTQIETLHDEMREMIYKSNGDLRLIEQLQHSTSRHLREGLVMTVEIARLQQRNSALEARRAHRQDTVAGILLTQNLANPCRKMTVGMGGGA